MGYDSCPTPGPRWFAIQPTMLEARRTYKTLDETPPDDIRKLSELFVFRLQVARAMVLIVGEVPQKGSICGLLRQASEAPRCQKYEKRPILLALSEHTFQVHYSGTGQYGVANYTFVCGDQRECGTDGPGELYRKAYRERLAFARVLWRHAVEMYFHLYWAESNRDLTYYGYWERCYKDPDELYGTAVKHGLFPSVEAARAACGNDPGEFRRLPQVDALGDRLLKQAWEQIHDEAWADFREADSVWHGHSD